MTLRNILIAFLLTVSQQTFCQEINKRIDKDSLKTSEQIESQYDKPLVQENGVDVQPVVDINVGETSNSNGTSIDQKAVEIKHEKPYLISWDGGMLTGYNGTLSNITSVRNIAGISAMQNWGNLSLIGSIGLSQGIGNGLGNVNGMNADMMVGYRLSRNVSIHAFGGMDNSGFMSSLPNAKAYYYGGYMSLLTNSGKVGFDMGVRRVFNNVTGRWETIPIAMPYYNLNGTKLGFDFGGLLYDVFNSAIDKQNKDGIKNIDPKRGPAVIAPPIDTKPHFNQLEKPKWADDQNN